jgi:type I restriction enzyme S subunit
MSEWKKVKLGECITTKKGFAFKSAQYVDKGIPVVRVSDFTLNSISEKDLVYYPISEYDKYFDYILYEKDILIQTVGSWQYNPNSVVGKVVRVPYYHKGSLLNQNIVKVIPNDDICKDFVYYRLKCIDFSGFVVGEARGAANQASITLDTIKRFSFLLPSYDTQHRIATILSRYDSLIENYQKQIKLLEEAAQRLYKEWFVDLHFPGHENTKIVDGVPEGWEKKTLDEYCSVFTGKKNANAAVPLGKYKFFTCGETPLQINSFIYDGPAIIISGNGSYTGRTTFYEGKFDLYQRTYACTISNNDNKDMIYGLFEIVKCELTAQISGGTHGAAIPYIVMGDVTKFTFTSNDIILRKFSKIIKSFLDRTMCISSQIRLLTEARDRLLPKLMNGEIKV